MRNLTISLPEGVLNALRDRAKAEQKSLNAWLRELLAREVAADLNWPDEFNRLADQYSAEAPGWKWNREDAYRERVR